MSWNKWNKYFIEMIEYVASKSKDRSTKVGAIITDQDNIIVATGFNGFPRGVDDDMSQRHERPAKYSFTEHAERNAIYAAARKGITLSGCKIYISWFPCCDCARGIIQSGIVEVYIDARDFLNKKTYWDERWYDQMVDSVDMLTEAEVGIYMWSDKHTKKVRDYRKLGDQICHKGKDIGTIQKQT